MKLDALARLSNDSEREMTRKLVLFGVGKLQCGLDIMRVREIIGPGPMVPIPSAPHYLIGATDHRETVVPIVDLPKKLGIDSEASQKTKWVIVDTGGMDLALAVDHVQGVITVSKSMERGRHPIMEGIDISWVKAVYGSFEGLVFELNLDAMFDFVLVGQNEDSTR